MEKKVMVKFTSSLKKRIYELFREDYSPMQVVACFKKKKTTVFKDMSAHLDKKNKTNWK